jgi:hypothetical protein
VVLCHDFICREGGALARVIGIHNEASVKEFRGLYVPSK